MAIKKEKSPKSKLEIQTRKPEKRGIFANLGNDRSKNNHPLREILNFPTEMDSKLEQDELSNKSTFGNPINNNSDIQEFLNDNPNLYTSDTHSINQNITNPQHLDSQKSNAGQPLSTSLDIRTSKPSNPLPDPPDSRNNKDSNPTNLNLDNLKTQKGKGLSKENFDLDRKISKSKLADIKPKDKKGTWKKYDGKRKSKGVFLRTSDEITKKFKQFCIAQDWDFSQGTELAWTKLMNDLDIQSEMGLDSLNALDDRRLKIVFKTNPLIIHLYLRYTKVFNELSAPGGKNWTARWTPRDDESAAIYNDVTASIIELGILQSQLQKGFGTRRIQNFKYYTDEIEKVITTGVSDEMLATILNYHRQMWQNKTGREVEIILLADE